MFPDSLMHQQRSQRNEGIQTIVAPGGRKMPQAWFSYLRRFLLCFAHPLFCFFWLFFFFFLQKPTKGSAKVQLCFFIVLLHRFAFPFTLSLHAHSFILSYSTIVACFCAQVWVLNVFMTRRDDVFSDEELASQLASSLCGLAGSPKSPVTRQNAQTLWFCKKPKRK